MKLMYTIKKLKPEGRLIIDFIKSMRLYLIIQALVAPIPFRFSFIDDRRCTLVDASAKEAFLKECIIFNNSIGEKNRYPVKIDVRAKIRSKYFFKMVEFFTTNRKTFEISRGEFGESFRPNCVMKSIIKNIHTLKELEIRSRAMTSKHFVSILRGGVSLLTLQIKETIIIGPKLTFTANGTSKLVKITISWPQNAIIPIHIKSNPHYFRNIFENIRQCPCAHTLQAVIIKNSQVISPEIIEKDYRDIKVKFCT
ncbi:unnamed protein product [Moneuplotes crassus]|uniref:Uncharacterized protein n=1 Tax=Euplotes crassus TaxID=5936 RepID=A0AAD1XSF1_EUPCR|nr:unnamed protein product [Moneuplotes crassus]